MRGTSSPISSRTPSACEHAGRTFVYSGDSGPLAEMEEFARGADVLVHMCHHISGTELSAAFADSCMGHMELAELAARAA